MKSSISFYGIPLGISAVFWLIVGFFRALTEWHDKRTKKRVRAKHKISEIAIIVPAHNEALVIRDCIQALKKIADTKQIFVISDGSTDKTYIHAWLEGCNVIGLHPGVGKAKALVHIIERYNLLEKYNFIFIVDADTKIDSNFLKKVMPIFNDPEVGVAFATARIHWQQHIVPNLRYYFISYRERLNRMLQFFFIYGQTWKYTNVNYVIPGFATVYRSSVLKQLQIDTPGLLIEDFNLAFQFHKKKLGKIAYHPSLIGWDQHPDNLRDYWRQVRRWNIGFFQTVRKNGFWPSFFWFSMGIFTFEVTLNSIFIFFVPFILLYALLTPLFGIPIFDVYINFYRHFGPFKQPIIDIFIGVFWFDYAMSVVFGLMTKKPQFIFYGLFFFFMHFVTSLILISSIIPGFFKSSEGRWVSPKRFLTESNLSSVRM